MPHQRRVSASTSERVRREARVAGLRDFQTPSLEAVERRRMQLWALSTVVLVTIAFGVLAVTTWPRVSESIVLSGPALRIAVLLLSAAFCAYAIEKEVHLQRLTRMLTDERVLIAALTNRLHEVQLLLDAGKAMNAVLELPAVLETILRSATELLAAGGGSVMLLEDDELIAVCIRGREESAGQRLYLGEGIAGHVATRREPLLIQGPADPREFPGLTDREPYVESAMSVPLIHREELLGVLNVNAPAELEFTQYDLRALSVFAEQAASAIANARLYESEREHVSEIRELRRVVGGEGR
jgi:two-component system, OmpR family, sensor histidine kinase KdpD